MKFNKEVNYDILVLLNPTEYFTFKQGEISDMIEYVENEIIENCDMYSRGELKRRECIILSVRALKLFHNHVDYKAYEESGLTDTYLEILHNADIEAGHTFADGKLNMFFKNL